MGLKEVKGNPIRVPIDLVFYDGNEKHLLSVYLAVACSANHAVHGKMVTKLSLRDIIYTMGLKPKRGKGGINEQVAIAVNKLRDLGCFKDAPDYFEHDYIGTKAKYRYEVAKPKEAKTYVTITTLEVFNAAQIVRNKDSEDESGNKLHVTFSYETLLRAMLLMKWKILRSKTGAIHVTRETLQELIDVSPYTITNITNALDKAKIIKKTLYTTREPISHGDEVEYKRHDVAFYTNYYGDVNGKINKEFERYEKYLKSKNKKKETKR